MRLAIFPLIQKGSWIFRTSVMNSSQIMIFAFGHTDKFLIRCFTNEDDARAFVDECCAKTT